jgi:uncharacterized RDD family membrane protein YckC
LPSPSEIQHRAEQEHWRREVASRVQQHRARRRRSDPDRSFELDFPAGSALAISPSLPPSPPVPVVNPKGQHVPSSVETTAAPEVSELRSVPKVIRFPRLASPSSAGFVDDQELAEPPHRGPGTFETPGQQLELPPAFPDIQLDELPPAVPLQSIDLPPQPASLVQRFFSGIVDFLLLLSAEGVLFGVFTELAGRLPLPRLALLFAMITSLAFWFLLQFVFLVFGRRTPGMRAAGVELSTFAGQPPSVAARRRRALAATLSAMSVGLGFLWALVDEDTFGWHDRISETYLRSGDRVIR